MGTAESGFNVLEDGEVAVETEEVTGSEYILPEMTTVEHLAELRRRILISVAAWVAGSVAGWIAAPGLLRYFAEDIGRSFIFVSPGEAFASQLKMALFVGLMLASPIIVVQAWLFVLPALFPHESRMARRYLVPSFALFVGGIAFAFFVVYPLALHFLLGFGTDEIQPNIAVGRFLTFLTSVTLPFGIVFQFPVVLVILVQLGFVTVDRLYRMRRMVIFLSVVIGALLTPPDVASQVLMAVPMILLYELTLLYLRKGARRHRS